MNQAAVIEADRLAKTYALGFFRKKVRAVREVSFSVEPGQIFAILGPNGAGKTTTLKILMGLVRPTAGRASVLGRPIGDLDAKRRLGYLPESPYFYDYLSGRELLELVGKLFGLDRRQARARADELLELVQMTRAGDLAMRRYSKGMLQRIGVAQALVNDPELVILDEPLTGLDPLGRRDLRLLIARLRTLGKTVVFSSHILSDVELLADRVVILVGGRTVKSGRLHELLDAKLLSVEVVLQGGTEALDQALKQAGYEVEARDGSLRVQVPGERSTDEVIDLGRAQGASIAMVTPRKESLEDLVVRMVEQARDSDEEGTRAVRAGA